MDEEEKDDGQRANFNPLDFQMVLFDPNMEQINPYQVDQSFIDLNKIQSEFLKNPPRKFMEHQKLGKIIEKHNANQLEGIQLFESFRRLQGHHILNALTFSIV